MADETLATPVAVPAATKLRIASVEMTDGQQGIRARITGILLRDDGTAATAGFTYEEDLSGWTTAEKSAATKVRNTLLAHAREQNPEAFPT